LQSIDWQLLFFLTFVLNVKMLVKIAAIILLLLLNLKMFREKNIYRKKIIWFYFSMIAITVVNLVLNFSTGSANYFFVVAAGIFFWMMCAIAALLTLWFIEKTETSKLHNTITLFFILNAAITLVQLLLIMWDSKSFNPFIYQGMYQKYFVNTGDYMKGLSFAVSTTNAILNAFGVIYFLSRNKMPLSLLCMSILLLTASNFTNVLLVLVLLFVFIFLSNRSQKSIITVSFAMLAVFIVKVSPQNNTYITDRYKKISHTPTTKPPPKNISLLKDKPDSFLSAEERKQKIAITYLDSIFEKEMKTNPEFGILKPSIPKPSIHSAPYQHKKDTTAHQRILLEFAIKNIPGFDTSMRQIKQWNVPGKLVALRQTAGFFTDHPLKIFFGNGVGNFSSKLALKAAGLGIEGNYPKDLVYINNDFKNNHLSLYLNYFSKKAELHSIINSPNNVYDQLVSEYGLTGFFSFVFLYIAFFIKKIKAFTYGIPIMLLMLSAFGVDYWFEQLSIVIVFELLMLLNIKESKEKYA